MKRFSLIACFLPVLLMAADKPGADQSKKDLEKLQGTWAIVAMEAEGAKLPEEGYKGVKVVFEKAKMTMGNGDNAEAADISLEASKKPKWINSTSKDGDKMQGIYELNGDNLKICMSKETDPRNSKPKLTENMR